MRLRSGVIQLSIGLAALTCSFAASGDHLSDLEKYASEVPIQAVTSEVESYIKNETNASIVGLKSHYTLALFENLKNGKSWYILDGYYELPSGEILFLDFVYKPENKVWWPIENYRVFIPSSAERFLLKAKNKCDPFERNFIGIILIEDQKASVDALNSYLEKKFKIRLSTLVTQDSIFVIDFTRKSHWGFNPEPIFTLDEGSLIANLKNELQINSHVIESGREKSNDEIKITYVGVTESCKRVRGFR